LNFFTLFGGIWIFVNERVNIEKIMCFFGWNWWLKVAVTVRAFNLTTKLNLQIISVVLLLMIAVMSYNYWLSLQEEQDGNKQQLAAITEFLVQKKPAGSFIEIAVRQGVVHGSVQEQVLAINNELRPMLADIHTLVPKNIIKYGFYSCQHNSLVAIGPETDISFLVGSDSSRGQDIYKTNNAQFLEKKNSLLWHGASVITHVRPIEENGIIIGHAFATINQDAVYSAIWKRTMNTFLGAFLMFLVCVVIFRELLVKLKQDLILFAETILAGRTSNFHSEITEFTPILNYISEQTEKMTRLDRLNIIGEMAAGIAHEVRNPMTTVRGLLQFMANKPEFIHHKANFDLMIDEIDRANSIITEFLSLAKNRAMEFSNNNLNDIIHNIYPLLQADGLRNNCEIEVCLGDIVDVYVDQNSIRQLIINMVRNGLDAMPRGGKIIITTKTYDEKVLLTIQDNGIGILPENRDKLGTPFFTTKDKGTGLGLAICYRIVQRHAANLTVESEPGQGTAFTIAFNPI
jgi:signal transduction histidine kinase